MRCYGSSPSSSLPFTARPMLCKAKNICSQLLTPSLPCHSVLCAPGDTLPSLCPVSLTRKADEAHPSDSGAESWTRAKSALSSQHPGCSGFGLARAPWAAAGTLASPEPLAGCPLPSAPVLCHPVRQTDRQTGVFGRLSVLQQEARTPPPHARGMACQDQHPLPQAVQFPLGSLSPPGGSGEPDFNP